MLQKRYVMFILSLLLILGTLGFAGEMSLAQLLEKAETTRNGAWPASRRRWKVICRCRCLFPVR